MQTSGGAADRESVPLVDASFTWGAAWDAVGGPPDGVEGVNIADRVIDRHVRAGRGDMVALRWFGRNDLGLEHPVDVTYAALAIRTNRFASALHRLGFGPATGVATLAGRIPELFVAALGTVKAGGVFTPLFSAFGPDPIAQRLSIGRVRVLVTTPVLLRRKVLPILDRLPDLELIVVADEAAAGVDDLKSLIDPATGVDLMSYGFFLGEGSDTFDTAPTPPDTPSLLHFTSGTTGEPKGAIHVHEALVVHHATGRSVLDLHEGDVYWCTADPGWVTGTSYGIIAPLAHGVTAIVDEADFDADRWYRMLVQERVNVFYTAPTAIRMLERLGDSAVAEATAGLPTASRPFADLRLVASVGEPLDADSVEWCQRVFQVPVLDNWWQTETGGIMIANRLGTEVRPGSMGRPVPGIDATLLQRDQDGRIALDADGAPIEVVDVGVTGELAIRAGWPSMFRGYLGRDERYRSCFVGGPTGWYRSGDLARRDADGYYWFVGRGDDVIKTAGHLIGPFEVESILDEHPAVVESGVIGKPDPMAGAVIKAFVVLHQGYEPTDELRSDLLAHCRRRLGAAVAPREIDFAEHLPHTRSGKIMRRVLRARELGEDEGDTSTLETPTTSTTEGSERS